MRFHRWIASHFGYRRYVLACFGIATVAFGFMVPLEADRWNPDEAILHLWLPVPVRMALWIITGLAALTIPAIWDRYERVGWAAAIVMPCERAISFGWSTLMWIVPGTPGGTPQAIPAAVIWTCVTAILIRVSTWPEASPTRLTRSRNGAGS